ncbi:titin [Aphelenchoides avenae]|nr:titin [Aphelenchus avenae]
MMFLQRKRYLLFTLDLFIHFKHRWENTGYLTITSFGREDAGEYACAHSASCSEFRVLHFVSVAVLLEHPRSGKRKLVPGLYAFKKASAVLGDAYRLVCRFQDWPGVRTTRWFFNDVPLEDHAKGRLRAKTHLVGDSRGANAMALHVKNFDDAHVGMYRCQVTYEHGVVDAEFLLKRAPLSIKAEEEVVTTVTGSKAQLACRYSSTPPLTEYHTEWLFNGTRLIDHDQILPKASETENVTADGQFEMRLTLEDFDEKMFGEWTCEVNNTREVAAATIRLRRESAWWRVVKDLWGDVKRLFTTP